MDLKELIDYCQVTAIANKLSPKEDSVYRSICRSYSKMFYTPLSLVFNLDPEHVILNVYEKQLDDLDEDKHENIEKMLNTVLNIENPNYEEDKEKQLQADIDLYNKEEEERLKSGKPLHPKLVEEPETYTEPKSGSVDLSHLENEDNK